MSMIDTDIRKTVYLINHNNRFQQYGEYAKLFYRTNEDLKFVCDRTNEQIKDGKVLTVTGSGDSALSFAAYGAKSIDTFHINRLSTLVFKLKLGALRALTYEENGELFRYLTNVYNVTRNKEQNFDYLLLRAIKEICDSDAKEYWERLLKLQITPDELYRLSFTMSYSEDKEIPYLDSDAYELLQKSIDKVKFSYITLPMDEAIKNYKNNRYKLIYFSNVFDCVKKGQIIKVLRMIPEMLEDNGIALSYSHGSVRSKNFDDLAWYDPLIHLSEQGNRCILHTFRR